MLHILLLLLLLLQLLMLLLLLPRRRQFLLQCWGLRCLYLLQRTRPLLQHLLHRLSSAPLVEWLLLLRLLLILLQQLLLQQWLLGRLQLLLQ